MKYCLLDKYKLIHGEKYYQIIALDDIYGKNGKLIAPKGSLGGYVKSETALEENNYDWILENEVLINGKIKKINDKYEMINPIRYIGGFYYRVKALKDFGDVKKGDIGGYIQYTSNLSCEGDCWVYPNAVVKDNAQVKDNAKIYDRAIIKDSAVIKGETIVKNCAIVGDAAIVGDKVVIEECAIVKEDIYSDNYSIYGSNKLYNKPDVNKVYKDDSFSIFKGCFSILQLIIILALSLIGLYFLFLDIFGIACHINEIVLFFTTFVMLICLGIAGLVAVVLIYKIIREIWMVYHLYVQEYKNNASIEDKLVKYQIETQFKQKYSKNVIITRLIVADFIIFLIFVILFVVSGA